MKAKVDQTSSSMTETGLHQFYLSFADYKQKLSERTRVDQEVDDFQDLTTSQLKRPLIIIFFFWSLAMLTFLIENIILKVNNRNRRVHTDLD